MKLLIIDIETTGYIPEGHSIVEIGIVLCDSDTRETIPVFNQIVKDDEWDYDKHSNAWIFQNTDLTPDDVQFSNHIDYYREELQSLFDTYLITAYNKRFDVGFLTARGFTLRDTKDLQETAKDVAKTLTGTRRPPSVERLYGWFFPEETYIEKHRGLDDALHEAKIFYKFCDMKAGKDVKLTLTEHKKPEVTLIDIAEHPKYYIHKEKKLICYKSKEGEVRYCKKNKENPSEVFIIRNGGMYINADELMEKYL
jgi:DNA polymerase-3 subunit epsilon